MTYGYGGVALNVPRGHDLRRVVMRIGMHFRVLSGHGGVRRLLNIRELEAVTVSIFGSGGSIFPKVPHFGTDVFRARKSGPSKR